MSTNQTPGSPVSKEFLRKRLPQLSNTAPPEPLPGDTWLDPTTPPTIPVSDTAPSNPVEGDLWVDRKPAPNLTVGAVPPVSPSINDIWIDLNS